MPGWSTIRKLKSFWRETYGEELFVPRPRDTKIVDLSIVFPIYGSGFRLVTPAKAGVQKPLIPASAGMTIKDFGT